MLGGLLVMLGPNGDDNYSGSSDQSPNEDGDFADLGPLGDGLYVTMTTLVARPLTLVVQKRAVLGCLRTRMLTWPIYRYVCMYVCRDGKKYAKGIMGWKSSRPPDQRHDTLLTMVEMTEEQR